MKTFLANALAIHLASAIRNHRRRLRDQTRHERRIINRMEKRLRGLRLYAAWGKAKKVIPLPKPKPQGILALLPPSKPTRKVAKVGWN